MISHSSESCTEWELKQSPLFLPTGRDLWEEPGLALSPPLPPVMGDQTQEPGGTAAIFNHQLRPSATVLQQHIKFMDS